MIYKWCLSCCVVDVFLILEYGQNVMVVFVVDAVCVKGLFIYMYIYLFILMIKNRQKNLLFEDKKDINTHTRRLL